MKKASKAQDVAASQIEFGVEIESMIPVNCGIMVGGYHSGLPVRDAIRENAPVGSAVIQAPQFEGKTWRADRDGSIACDPGYMPCEFVSPVLKGEAGIACVRQMIAFIKAIGGKVNRSCGLHITIGLKSVIGSCEIPKVAEYVQKLAHVAQRHAWAIYAQTGTDRHANHYAHTLRLETESLVEQMTQTTDAIRLSTLANQCGRGMVNFQKAFRGETGAVEFRAFAGTLNESKMLHHIATAFGIARRAVTVQTFGKFNRKAGKKHQIANAVQAIKKMWSALGWCDATAGRECALGLFGALHAEFGEYRTAALKMAEQFDTRFPNANL